MADLRALSPASRKSKLSGLPRSQLQRLAKEAGLKANVKSVDIINSLLDALNLSAAPNVESLEVSDGSQPPASVPAFRPTTENDSERKDEGKEAQGEELQDQQPLIPASPSTAKPNKRTRDAEPGAATTARKRTRTARKPLREAPIQTSSLFDKEERVEAVPSLGKQKTTEAGPREEHKLQGAAQLNSREDHLEQAAVQQQQAVEALISQEEQEAASSQKQTESPATAAAAASGDAAAANFEASFGEAALREIEASAGEDGEEELRDKSPVLEPVQNRGDSSYDFRSSRQNFFAAAMLGSAARGKGRA